MAGWDYRSATWDTALNDQAHEMPPRAGAAPRWVDAASGQPHRTLCPLPNTSSPRPGCFNGIRRRTTGGAWRETGVIRTSSNQCIPPHVSAAKPGTSACSVGTVPKRATGTPRHSTHARQIGRSSHSPCTARRPGNASRRSIPTPPLAQTRDTDHNALGIYARMPATQRVPDQHVFRRRNR